MKYGTNRKEKHLLEKRCENMPSVIHLEGQNCPLAEQPFTSCGTSAQHCLHLYAWMYLKALFGLKGLHLGWTDWEDRTSCFCCSMIEIDSSFWTLFNLQWKSIHPELISWERVGLDFHAYMPCALYRVMGCWNDSSSNLFSLPTHKVIY